MHGLKNYNLIVEPWPGNPGPNGPRGRTGYRWRVNWKLQGEFYAEGFEDSHAAARAAAEAYLIRQGIEIMSLSRPAPPVPAEFSAGAVVLPLRQASQRT
ncbi:MAG: hypothetical protein RLN99_17260 [Kiloniellaceae bacterium]